MSRLQGVEFQPLTPARVSDLERLFGAHGACGGCWCMWWKLSRAEFVAGRGAGNRRKLRAGVQGGATPGILAYAHGEPVAWCALEPREAYPRLARSRTLAPVDEKPVWSMTCFYVARSHRGRGMTRALIDAAVEHARSHGARLVEAYQREPRARQADASVYTGVASTFRRAGFREVARRSAARPIMRRTVRPRRPGSAAR